MTPDLPRRARRTLAAGCVALTVAAACAKRDAQSGGSGPGLRVETVGGKSRYTNRLISEKSPYLQLHAHNPVDWYPWGDAAFEKAKREGKPIFLSVGYSTCHWCHVMEAESFSDPAIAEVMNRSFVSIKVDREERPDVDRVYMSYVVSATGGGGWPMSVFLTPDLKPFLGGGYFPPDDRDGNVGFRTLLQRIAADWDTKRERILEAAANGTTLIEAEAGSSPSSASPAEPRPRELDGVYRAIAERYDPEEGGFGAAPKFPRPVILNFLFREHARTRSKPALDMALHTLRAMALGGISDRLGGGFHRYSTDRSWRVPHFEKMLYDQAQLAVSYTDAFQITRDTGYADVARGIFDYVLRDLRGPDGAFLSAEDADSAVDAAGAKQSEGAFYVWTADEIQGALGVELGGLFSYHYGIQAAGNVPANQDVEGQLNGKNVLYVAHTIDETAAKFHRPEAQTRDLLETGRQKLAAAQRARPRPARDDKVLTAWNGLMISALARAAQVLDEPKYLDAARASAGFIQARMYDPKANLLKRRYRQGNADIDAVVEDYACLIQGLLDLYEASFEVKWLMWAVQLQTQQDRLFWDAKGGGYFSTRADASHILVRMKDDYDGPEPAAGSVSAMNLLRLWQMTDQKRWHEEATAIARSMGTRLSRSPGDLPQLASAIDFLLSKPKQIVVAGDAGASDTHAMLRLVHERFIPNKILLLADGGAGQAQLAEWLPFVTGMNRRDGKATIYVCENYACRLPTSDLQVAARLLDGQPVQ